MSRAIFADQMSADQLRQEIAAALLHWHQLMEEGSSDPCWPDGCNLNLVRNHIIYYDRILREKTAADKQISLFDDTSDPSPNSQIPPRVPETYMVAGGRYANRLADWDATHAEKLVYSF